MGRILVTGATGNVGTEVLRLLAQAGEPAVAGIRAPRAEQAVRLDFEDAASFSPALEGVDRVFLVRPPAISNVKQGILPFLRAAADARVRHVVFLSLLGAEKNRFVPHRAIEDFLRESGMEWTFLRASFFMQNLSTTHRADIRDRNEIDVPAGRGTTSFVDARDVAAAAARVITQPGHARRAYDLTGAEALTYGEVARIFSEVLGRPVTYRNPSIPGFVRRMRRGGHPWPFVLVMAGIYTTARLGLAGRLSDDLPWLLGRAPITMRRFVQDYRECWM
jgi:uncharacterized protein YbjT (DUF2867 family)